MTTATLVIPRPAPPRAPLVQRATISADAERVSRKRPGQSWKRREFDKNGSRKSTEICSVCAQEGAKEVTLIDGLVRLYCKPCELA